MEQRIATVLILIEDREKVALLNKIISEYAEVIIGRQGIRLSDRNKSIISLVIEGNTNEIGGLSGKLGRISGINVKSVVLKTN